MLSETLRVIHFDTSRSILAVADYPGEPTRVFIPLRTIISDALKHKTAGLILSHNHPSGDPTPSAADIAATRTLARAVEPLGIRLHDHIVSGAGQSVSFRTLGLI
jgi:DNA repair protein RadC